MLRFSRGDCGRRAVDANRWQQRASSERRAASRVGCAVGRDRRVLLGEEARRGEATQPSSQRSR